MSTSDHNARQQILSGLEARAAKRGVSFGEKPTAEEIQAHNGETAIQPVTAVADLTRLAVESEAAHAGLTQLFDETADQIHEEKEGIIANLRNVGLSLAQAQQHPLAAGVVATFVQATTDKRMAALQVLLKNAAVAEESAPLFSSPAAMLQTSMLLNEKKKTYVESLKASGANELVAMSVKAKAEGDAALASAVLTVADGLPEHMRKSLPQGFRSSLADHFAGAQHRAAVTALSVVKHRLRSAQLASNSFARTGRRSAESVLSHGLAKAREGAA